jgi:hypothetical protein
VPVILVFTKFDELVTTIVRDMDGRDAQHYARAKARAKCEETCRVVFHKASNDVPAGVVSGIELRQGFVEGATDISNRP